MHFTINLSGIDSKVKAWSKSPEGKKRLQEHVRGMAGKGSGKTAAGSSYLGEKDFIRAAEEMVAFVKSAAASAGLPSSVMDNINSLTYTKPYQDKDGMMRIDLYFADGLTGDLSRESLYSDSPKAKRRDGVDNIIALFNNGMDASVYAYGFWMHHQPTSERIPISFVDESIYVRSVKHRDALLFMQNAVSAFNEKYSASSVSAKLDEDEYTHAGFNASGRGKYLD